MSITKDEIMNAMDHQEYMNRLMGKGIEMIREEPVLCEVINPHITREYSHCDAIHHRKMMMIRELKCIKQAVQDTAQDMPYELIEKYNRWIEDGYILVREEGKLYEKAEY